MEAKDGPLSDVLDELRGAAEEGGETVKVGHLIDALDSRGYGPALAVLPLIELTPLGGIPGFPTALALVLAILALRLLLGYEHFWAPGFIRNRSLKTERVEKALEWLKPVSRRIDATLHERLKVFSGPAGQRAACIAILALLCTVPPLELIPFATSGPMVVISLFGLAILFRDGLLMLIAFIGTALTAGFGLWALLGRG